MSTRFYVVVDHQEGPDWALVLTACRVGDNRSFIPFIFASDSDGLFATCPNADVWARSGKLRLFNTRGLTPATREQLLKNAVSGLVEDIHRIGSVLDYTHVGLVNSLVAVAYNKAMPGFTLDAEPAFRWLYERKLAAVQAMGVCRYLAQKHGLDKLSIRELEAEGTRRVLKGL